MPEITKIMHNGCAFRFGGGGGNIGLLVVGGGGGSSRGGGGGGGVIYRDTMCIKESSYSVVVGSGGANCSDLCCHGQNGGNSKFGPCIAYGGGGGGGGCCCASCYVCWIGYSGGSGGGSGRGYSSYDPLPGGQGIKGQGYDGGEGLTYNSAYNCGGGGGGAGGRGNMGFKCCGEHQLNGVGGIGANIKFPRGTELLVAPGGMGSGYSDCSRGYLCYYYAGCSSIACNFPGQGGSYITCCELTKSGIKGIVVVRYPTDGSRGIKSATGGSKYTHGDYTVHCFISDGTFTPVFK